MSAAREDHSGGPGPEQQQQQQQLDPEPHRQAGEGPNPHTPLARHGSAAAAPASPATPPAAATAPPREAQDAEHEAPDSRNESTACSSPSRRSRANSDSSNSSSSSRRSGISRIPTHVSMGPDSAAEAEHFSSFVEVPDSVYDRFSKSRKIVIVIVLSFCSFLAPISSTAVLSAVPEVAAEFHTTGAVINISNAIYLFFMGISPMVWSPLSQVYGRRAVNLTTAVLFTACSIGTVFADSLGAFIVCRILTAFEGTSFIVVGSTVISDIYRPTERATAMGWFLSGTLVGPAMGPFIAGVIVTFQSWRVIFWLQTALGALALLGVFFLLPETAHRLKKDDLIGVPRRMKARVLWSMINPLRVVKLYLYPNLTLAGLAAGALLFNMYSLLTPIRYVINPRFGLETPMLSGFFYLAPGCGYLVGTFMGGRYADYMVKKWIAKRDGQRIPEDRLRSAIFFMGVVIPVCTLAYGWGLTYNAGGIPLAAIMLFVQAVAQLFCFPSLNTYCLDVMQPHAAEVVAGNYMFRYMFACLGTAVALPGIGGIGVGGFCTVSAGFLAVAALGLVATIRWGKAWREARDGQRRAKRAERRRVAAEAQGGESGPGAKEMQA